MPGLPPADAVKVCHAVLHLAGTQLAVGSEIDLHRQCARTVGALELHWRRSGGACGVLMAWQSGLRCSVRRDSKRLSIFNVLAAILAAILAAVCPLAVTALHVPAEPAAAVSAQQVPGMRWQLPELLEEHLYGLIVLFA